MSSSESPNPYQPPQGRSTPRVVSRRPRWLVEYLTWAAVVGAIAPFPLIVWIGETEPFYGPFYWPHAAISSLGAVIGLGWIAWYAYICFAVSRGWLKKIVLLLVVVAMLFGGLSFSVLYAYLSDRGVWNSGVVN